MCRVAYLRLSTKTAPIPVPQYVDDKHVAKFIRVIITDFVFHKHKLELLDLDLAISVKRISKTKNLTNHCFKNVSF